MEKWESDLIAALGKSTPATESSEEQDEDYETSNLEKDNERMRDKLERVADILAGAGIIHNTPTAKRLWIDA
jgi:hypothetical protein